MQGMHCIFFFKWGRLIFSNGIILSLDLNINRLCLQTFLVYQILKTLCLLVCAYLFLCGLFNKSACAMKAFP